VDVSVEPEMDGKAVTELKIDGKAAAIQADETRAVARKRIVAYSCVRRSFVGEDVAFELGGKRLMEVRASFIDTRCLHVEDWNI